MINLYKLGIGAVLLLLTIGLVSACKKEAEETVEDADQTAALKNVTVTYNGTTFQLGLPAGASSGKSFEQLRKEDSVTYTNPENYSVSFTANMTADNTKDNARDAAFEGMTVNIMMDTIHSAPIATKAGPFTVLKGTKLPVPAVGTINLKTHRLTCLYIFRQVASSADLATTLTPILHYKIGALAGNLPGPSVYQNIPTTADAQTKAFLQGLLDSGKF